MTGVEPQGNEAVLREKVNLKKRKSARAQILLFTVSDATPTTLKHQDVGLIRDACAGFLQLNADTIALVGDYNPMLKFLLQFTKQPVKDEFQRQPYP
jgi:hypothetical protein